eukprot:3999293-Pyramimonas_sp.AAC.1
MCKIEVGSGRVPRCPSCVVGCCGAPSSAPRVFGACWPAEGLMLSKDALLVQVGLYTLGDA